MLTFKSLAIFLQLSAVSFFLTLSTAHAQVVECRDAQGKKIFANSCPTGTTKTKEISPPANVVASPASAAAAAPTTTSTTAPASPANIVPNNATPSKVTHNNSAPTKSAKTAAESSREFAEWKRRQDEEEGLVRDQKRAEENQCYQDQKRLRELLNGLPIQTGVDANGEPIFMEDEKRLEEIKTITERSKKCKPT
jgi:hypothetical protein